MRLSGTAGTALVFVLIAGVGAGTYIYKGTMENRRLQLQNRQKEMVLKTKEADRATKEAEAQKAKREATKAEADKARAASEAAKSKSDLEAKQAATEQAEAEANAAEAKAKQSEAAKLAAEAETKKNESAKAASEAELAAQTKKAEAESIALKKAEQSRKQADAQLADTLAKKRIAEAALKKSENELKAAQELAQAERDRKLRMYRRAETSRAEMLALQRAERLLALDEAGALTTADLSADANAQPAVATDGTPKTNAVVKVDWPKEETAQTAAENKVSSMRQKMDEVTQKERKHRAREYIATLSALAVKADQEQRAADAAHFRRTLVVLVPNYVDEYTEMIDAARKRSDAKEEARLCTELLSLVPQWQRVAVGVQLVERDEAYFSKMLAGRLGRDEFVKCFRKLYDKAMRDKGERDERRAKMEHICTVLATYVPDFEKSPEWK